MNEASRRFPAPWRAERIEGGYVIKAATGQAVAWVYARATINEALEAEVLTMHEAHQIAVNIAKLPDLVRLIHR